CLFLIVGAPVFGGEIVSTWKEGNGKWNSAGDWGNTAPNKGNMRFQQTAGGTLDIEFDRVRSSRKGIVVGAEPSAGKPTMPQFAGFTAPDSVVFQLIGSLFADNFATPVSFIPNFTFMQAPVSNVIDLKAGEPGGPPGSKHALIGPEPEWHVTFRKTLRIGELG